MKEIWKDIEGYEGLYQICTMGRVRSVRNNVILKSKIERNGYERVILSTNNIPKGYFIHRLVANAFIPNPDNLPQVNHKDENKANNRVDNLEWCDGKYNINYGTGTRRRQLANTNGKLSKPVLQYTLEGIFIKEWKSTMDVQRNLGFDHPNISRCCRGKYACAYGYIWKYKKEIE